ncbi:MAG TPA: Ldh family oxidoreductase [Burkholderiales bacterium]|nr:Ldh family oxidoreductase [Burkholderiales bacterium]
MSTRYAAAALTQSAVALLQAAGVDAGKAQAVAEILVEGDLMGHDTHGLALLGPYLGELQSGAMLKTGEPEVLNSRPAAAAWDGRRLPGPWLVLKAMDECAKMARTYGTGSITIRRSHHIAALTAYLKRATDQGLVMLLYCSDRNSASVAPHGGLDPVFTPNPMAFGIPTGGMPILVDVSCSITTNGMNNRLAKEGKPFPHKWLIDDKGEATDDPKYGLPGGGGTIQLLGGMEVGHKGYGLTLMVEALTGGLTGNGRADPKEGWGATVFVQVLDPEAFGGLAGMQRQVDWVADACRNSRPRPGFTKVRLPGERGLERRAAQQVGGIELHASIMPLLTPWAEKYKIALPQPL